MIRSFVLVTALIMLSCRSDGPGPQSKESWHNSMQRLSASLSELLPAVLKGGEPTERDKKVLREQTRTLQELAHNLSGQSASPDPMLKVVSREFNAEVADIQKWLDSGNWAIAKSRLYQVTQFCVSCHTSSGGQPSAFALQFNDKLEGLDQFEKARFFAATRQFDAAIKEFERAIADKSWGQANPDKLEFSLMSTLALVTHVRKDPNLAVEIISNFRDQNLIPEPLKPASLAWRQQAKEWEKSKGQTPRLADIEKRVKDGLAMIKPPNAGVFLLVRAVSDAHHYLALPDLKPRDQARALWLLGKAGAGLGDLNYFSLPDQSLEMCIERAPKTPLARACYDDLRQYLSARRRGEDFLLSDIKRLDRLKAKLP